MTRIAVVVCIWVATSMAAESIDLALDEGETGRQRLSELETQLTFGEFANVAAEADRMIQAIEATASRYVGAPADAAW